MYTSQRVIGRIEAKEGTAVDVRHHSRVTLDDRERLSLSGRLRDFSARGFKAGGN
jgi:hypothetical protein